MKDLGKIIFYLIATVVLGALLAPLLCWGLHWLNSLGFLTGLADTEFRKFFHRGLLVAALALLWPVARWIDVPGVRALGLRPNPRRWEDLGVGLGASLLGMVALAVVVLNLGVYKIRGQIQWEGLAEVCFRAGTVAILEEWLFRGAILGLVLRAMKPAPALLSVSALFSILHFLKPQEHLPPDHVVNWLSGFALIPGAFAQFEEPWLVLGGFTTLFCVGWILGWVRLRTGGLAMAIGLHAGWILGKMGLSKIALRKIKDTLPWLGEDITIGLGSVVTVLLTGLLVWLWLTRFRRPTDNRDDRALTPAEIG